MYLLPGSGAVSVEDVKVFAREQLAAVDARLDGTEAAQNADLFHVADEWHNVQPLQFGVNGVQSADQVLQEKLKGLRQAEHRLAVDDERGHLLIAIVNQFALIGRRVRAGNGRRAVAAVRRAVAVVVAVAVPTRMHPVRMPTVVVVAVQRALGALQVGGGGSCGRCSRGCRMAEIKSRVITVRHPWDSRQTGQGDGPSRTHTAQESSFSVQKGALISGGSGGGRVQCGKRHGRRHAGRVQRSGERGL